MTHNEAFDVLNREAQKRIMKPAQLLSDWLARRNKTTNETDYYSKEVNEACKIITNNK